MLEIAVSVLRGLSCSPLFYPQLHSDADRGDGSVRYVLTGEGAGTLFKIDEKSGDIHATKRLDREEKAYYILHAKAVNRVTNEALEGQSEFVIKIHDINDNEPRFTKDPYIARVPEMSDIGEFLIGPSAQHPQSGCRSVYFIAWVLCL